MALLMVKKPEMPIQQEKRLSSDFHMAMLQELEVHHDEKSEEWIDLDPIDLVREALGRLYRYGPWFQQQEPIDRKQLVHAANYLSIAWAIMRAKEGDSRELTQSAVRANDRVLPPARLGVSGGSDTDPTG